MAKLRLDPNGQEIIIQGQNEDGQFTQSTRVDIQEVINLISEEKQNIEFQDQYNEGNEEIKEDEEIKESNFTIILENIKNSKNAIFICILLLFTVYGISQINFNKSAPKKIEKTIITNYTDEINKLNESNKKELEYQKQVREHKNEFIKEAELIYLDKIKKFDNLIEKSIKNVKENESQLKDLKAQRINASQVKQVPNLSFNQDTND